MKQIDARPGEFVEVPRGPLDKPSRLYWGMALCVVLGANAIAAMIMSGMHWGLAICTPVPFVLLGIAIAGRWPAALFRRDR